jgi:hypothetical protein
MELYINDIRVDLESSIPFPLTYQISDIRNIDQRKGNSSKTIKLPGTRKNCELMATVYSLTTTQSDDINVNSALENFDPSIKASARYYQNGILQFEGIAQLIDCTRTDGVWSFNIVMFAEQIDIFTLLKNYKLRELGWSEYNHDLTYTNISNSWSGSIIKNSVAYNNFTGVEWNGEGYYYGLIDYGFDRPAPNQFEVDQIPLQVFVKNIVDKMFEKIQVDYQSSFMDSQRFKKMLMAYEGGILPNIDSATAGLQSVETDQKNNTSGFLFDNNYTLQQIGSSNVFVSSLNTQYVDVLYYSDDTTDVDPEGQIQTHEPLRIVVANEGTYTLTYSGDHDVNLDVTLTNGSGSSDVSCIIKCKVQVLKNNQVYQEEEIYQNSIISSSLTNSFTASFTSTFDLAFDVNDDFKFKLIWSFENLTTLDSTATSATANLNVTATACELDLSYNVQEIVPGGTVTIGSFLPDMDCGTFFKGLINMFNLIVKPDADNAKKIVIEPLDDFYNGSDTAEDWTYIVAREREFKVTPTVNFASKEYLYKFVDDADYWNARYFTDVVEQYGAKTITSGSQFATGQTKNELPFANKLLGQIPTTDLIVPRNFQVKTEENGTSEIVERRGKAFIVQIKDGNVGTLQSGTWSVIDEFNVAQNLTSYPYVGHLDDIDSPSFDLMFEIPSYVFYDIPSGINYTTANLFSLYHERFIKELVDRNGKMLTCYINLNADIINRLDFANLVRIDNVVYRLQKIESYDPKTNEPTKCELIRLIEGDKIQNYTITSVPDDVYLPPSEKKARVTEANLIRDIEDNSDTRRIE